MIHVFVGTKAQFIKMAPIMQELDRRGAAYNFIDAGQHAGLTGDLVRQFHLREPDVFLRKERTNVETIAEAIGWTWRSLGQVTFKRKQVSQRVFRGESGVCLIHGDTLTTLLSLMYAKRCGLEVAHVEAGLRSYSLVEPFPEEIIRLIAMRYGDLLFAPSDWAFENLCRMGYGTKSVNVGGNTIEDTVRYAQKHIEKAGRSLESYVVVTIHRVETIYSRSRLMMVAGLVERIARERKVTFVLHEPTRRQLSRFGLYDRFSQNPAVELLPLQPYLHFISLIAGADYVVTDGGSIQEETFALNVPCLIMRSKTERMEGLGENAYLAEFHPEQVERFFNLLPSLRRRRVEETSPSSVIVDHLMAWA